MLSRVARCSRTLNQVTRNGQSGLFSAVLGTSIRQNSTDSPASNNANEIYTKLSDTKDPQRNQFFQYTWGSWLTNDKSKRNREKLHFLLKG